MLARDQAAALQEHRDLTDGRENSVVWPVRRTDTCPSADCLCIPGCSYAWVYNRSLERHRPIPFDSDPDRHVRIPSRRRRGPLEVPAGLGPLGTRAGVAGDDCVTSMVAVVAHLCHGVRSTAWFLYAGAGP